jgi:peptide/nickel transport system permease protein
MSSVAPASLARGIRARRRVLPGTWPERIAALVLVVLIGMLVLGPALAPYGADQLQGVPYSQPGGGFLFGTDALGRDVLSRVLDGGQTLFVEALLGTLVAYVIGAAIGLAAAYLDGRIGFVLMRGIDLLMAFPPLLLILVLISGTGRGSVGLVIAIIVSQFPAVARIVRAAASEVSTRGFVDAARARGEGTPYMVIVEILPNIRATVMADFGSRFTLSVLLVAALGFLGVGAQPPAPNWAAMISDNVDGLSLNPWASLAPALIIAALTVSANLLADGAHRRSRLGPTAR